MFCRKCGAQLKLEAKFCKQCGNPVGAAQQRPNVMPPVRQPAQRAPESRPAAPAQAASPATKPPAAASSVVLPIPEGPTRELSAPPPPEFTIAPPAATVPPRAPNRQPEPAKSFSYSKASAPAPLAETPGSTTISPLPPPTSRVAYRSAISSPPAVRTARSPVIMILVLSVVIAAAAGGGYFLHTHFHPSDATIVANLKSKFDADASLHNATIGVTSQNGLVILVGYVGSDADNSNAIRIAGAEPGVKQVVAHLVTQNQVRTMLTGPSADANLDSNQQQGTGLTAPDESNKNVQTATPQDQQEQPAPPLKAVGPSGGSPSPIQDTPQARLALPTVVQPLIQPGGTSLELAPGQMYIYGMVTGGAQQSGPFATGQVAQVVNGSNNLAAAFAYGDNPRNGFSTPTYNHAIGGVSVSGQWDDFHAYYGSNARPGASIVAASFTLNEKSLVVIIGLAAGQTRVSFQGIPGLQVDGASSDAGGGMPMMIAHASLSPGIYTAVETSVDTAHQDAASKADLIGVFVFGSKQ